MPTNLYLKKCPVEEGKVVGERFYEWVKYVDKNTAQHMIQHGEKKQGVIKEAPKEELSSRCHCSIGMNIDDKLVRLELEEVHEGPGTEAACKCPVWDANKPYIEKIRNYFNPIRSEESDV